MRGLRTEAAVFTHTRRGLLRRNLEDDLVEFEAEVLNGLVDVIAVAIADVLEGGGGNAHMQRATVDVREARGLQPGLKALTIDLLFQRAEDPNPLVQDGCRDRLK